MSNITDARVAAFGKALYIKRCAKEPATHRARLSAFEDLDPQIQQHWRDAARTHLEEAEAMLKEAEEAEVEHGALTVEAGGETTAVTAIDD